MREKSAAGRPKDPEKSKQILESAGELFKEKGFATTSMDAIAQHAGVSKQTLYSHFSGKDDLFKQVIKCKVDHYQFDDLESQLSWDIQEDLCKIGHFLLGLVLDEEAVGMMATVISEARKAPKVAGLFYETGPGRVNATLEKYLKAQHGRGAIVIDDPHELAILFMNMLKGEWHMQALMNAHPDINAEHLEKHVRKTVERFLTLVEAEAQ